MKKTVLASLLGIIAISMIGCASSMANLKRESAMSIGNLTSDQVTISDVQRGALNIQWNAQTDSETYNCEADDMLRRVNCVKK